MQVRLNRIGGIEDAIVSMYVSKRHLPEEMEDVIRNTCVTTVNHNGVIRWGEESCAKFPHLEANQKEFGIWMDKLCKYGAKHTTLLKFVDFSFTVRGLHRAGQDDWDSHAKRFDNRIIRESTRLAKFTGTEKSDYYADKIMTTDEALMRMGIMSLPEEYIDDEGNVWIRKPNGYVREGYENTQDVERGLYMLSIPSTFTFKVDLVEWAHVYKMRRRGSGAHPEVSELCETCCDLIEEAVPWFNRDLFNAIQN